MKILFVGDNRNRKNFGCRSTSIALSQLVSKKHEIINCISGNFTLNKGYVFFIPGLPKWVYFILGKIPLWKLFRHIWWKALRKIVNSDRSLMFDFARNSPIKSLKNFLKCLPANEHLQELNLLNYSFDALVINGEGTMIMTNPARRDSLIYMMLTFWAKDLGKKVFFVNAMFSDSPVSGKNYNTIYEANKVFSNCDALVVRDPVSLEYIKNNLKNCNATYIPDALFTWNRYVNDSHKLINGRYYLPFGFENNEYFDVFNFTEPFICLSGSSMSAWNQKIAEKTYCNLVAKLKREIEMKLFLVQTCNGDRFLINVAKSTETPILIVDMPLIALSKVLAKASLFISGRYHPSIVASLGGTPCVFLGSNSHKTYSLQKILEYQKLEVFNAYPDEFECEKIVKSAKRKLEEGISERKRIFNVTQTLASKSEEILNII